MAQLLEQDVGVGKHTRVLARTGYFVKDFLHIGHVEVGTDAKVLGPPVVTAQKGVDIRKTTLAGSGIPEVAHIDFACKRQMTNSISGVAQLLLRNVFKMSMNVTEDFLNGGSPHGPLAEHVFLTGSSVQLYTCQSRAFLAAVVLLFHHQVQFVQTIHPRTVMLLVVRQGFQQADHGYSTFMF